MPAHNKFNFAGPRRPVFFSIQPSPEAASSASLALYDADNIVELVLDQRTLQTVFLTLADFPPIQAALDEAILNTGRRLGYQLRVKARRGRA